MIRMLYENKVFFFILSETKMKVGNKLPLEAFTLKK